MKSPWKLLGRLISRRDSRPEADSAIENVPAEENARQLRIADPNMPVAVSGKAGNLDHLDPFGKKRSAPATGEDGEAFPSEPRPAEPEAALKRRARRTGIQPVADPLSQGSGAGAGARNTRKQNAPVAMQPEGAVDRKRANSSENASPFTEATELDDEIRHLRRQLADRLRQQNQQLRAMSERFEDR